MGDDGPLHDLDEDSMSRTKLQSLWSPSGPWIYVGFGEPERTDWFPSYFYGRPGSDVCVRRLRGWKMPTTKDLMTEFGAAFQFFDGFGDHDPGCGSVVG